MIFRLFTFSMCASILPLDIFHANWQNVALRALDRCLLYITWPLNIHNICFKNVLQHQNYITKFPHYWSQNGCICKTISHSIRTSLFMSSEAFACQSHPSLRQLGIQDSTHYAYCKADDLLMYEYTIKSWGCINWHAVIICMTRTNLWKTKTILILHSS